MLCEVCGKNPATSSVVENPLDKERGEALHLCQNCAASRRAEPQPRGLPPSSCSESNSGLVHPMADASLRSRVLYGWILPGRGKWRRAAIRVGICALLILVFRYHVLAWSVGAVNFAWKLATRSERNHYGCVRHLSRLRLPGARMLVRIGETHVLAKVKDPAMVPALLQLYEEDPEPRVRAASLRGLCYFWDERIRSALKAGLFDPDRAVRRAAILGSMELGDESFLPLLAEAGRKETDDSLKILLKDAPGSLVPVASPSRPKPGGPSVKVAAIQFRSRFNAPEPNRVRLVGLIREAVANGAKIVVLPETAITGYLTTDLKTAWQLDGWPTTPGFIGVSPAASAETVPGVSTQAFARLSGELSIHLTVPILEFDPASGKYYNTLVLTGPDGNVLLHYRKLDPWPFAERGWASAGDRGHQFIDTSYGRLGLLICYDINRQAVKLKENRVDTLLYAIAWVDREKSTWFHAELPRIARRNNVNIVGANWTVPSEPDWHGYGQSLIVERTGRVLARASRDIGEETIYADVPVPAGF